MLQWRLLFSSYTCVMAHCRFVRCSFLFSRTPFKFPGISFQLYRYGNAQIFALLSVFILLLKIKMPIIIDLAFIACARNSSGVHVSKGFNARRKLATKCGILHITSYILTNSPPLLHLSPVFSVHSRCFGLHVPIDCALIWNVFEKLSIVHREKKRIFNLFPCLKVR